jgi:tRNA (guanine37-N1)-methyltransferase
MKITVLSLFPEILRGFFESSIMAKAVERGILSFELVNIRDYAIDKHHKCDDLTFGGGAGMLMLPDPLCRALEAAGATPREAPAALASGEDSSASVAAGATPHEAPMALASGEDSSASVAAGATPREAPAALASSENAADPGAPPAKRTIFVTPSGRLFNQAMAADFSREAELVIVCGRYEGIDQRVIDRYVTDEVSVGDYVLSSGEVAALVLVDAVYRLVPGVISGESLLEESFAPVGTAGDARGPALLEYPQYTRPAMYDNLRVPEVLTSGHHAKIVRWRLRESIKKTLAYRPELLAAEGLPSDVRKLLSEIVTEGGDDEPTTENSSAANQGR